MTIKALYPTVRPTLNLDFAKTKALDPRVTFTRASTATFVGSNGLIQTAASGAARFDHNPETGESLGLLLEEERTNRVLSSQSLPFVINPTYWTVTNLSTGAPNGEGFARVNCVSFSATTLTFNYDVSGLVSGSSVLTVSLYARSNDTNVQLGLGNPDTVILGTTPALTSEWVRYSGTFTWSGSNVIRFFRSVGSISAGQSFDVCMVSIEEGSFPTSYIPTVASTVTRAADVASMTGTNFSSWYRQSEGTWLINFANDAAKQGAFRGVLSLGGNNTPRIQGNSVVGYGGSLSFTPTALTKAGLAYGSTEGRAVNGSVTSGAGGTIDIETYVDIGTGASSSPASYMLSTSIARLTYYPVRLPDAQLQALTAT